MQTILVIRELKNMSYFSAIIDTLNIRSFFLNVDSIPNLRFLNLSLSMDKNLLDVHNTYYLPTGDNKINVLYYKYTDNAIFLQI